MAIITNAFSTYTAIGNREDLTDQIYNVDPADTPFSAGIPRTPAKAVQHDWQTDKLDDLNDDNAHLEGDETTRVAVTPTVRPINVCQISKKNATVTGTQEVVDKAGRASEMAYQMDLKTTALRRDMEGVLMQNRGRVAGNETTPRKLGSLGAWVGTNTNRGATGTDPTNNDGSTPAGAGTGRALTEDMLKDVLKKVFDSGGNPTVIMCGSTNKQVISGFTGRASARQNVDANTIQAAADMYVGDFGNQTVIPNRFQRASDVWVFDMDYVALSFLRQFVSYPLAKTGDAETREILSEYTLEMRNQKAHGVIADALP